MSKERYIATGLNEIMKRDGRKRSWLANRLGVSLSHASHLIGGQRTVSRERAEQIAGWLEVPMGEAFTPVAGTEVTSEQPRWWEQRQRYLATHVRERLEEEGRRQRWLAEQLGISQALMTRIIKGERTVSRQDAEKMAELLRSTVPALFEPYSVQKHGLVSERGRHGNASLADGIGRQEANAGLSDC